MTAPAPDRDVSREVELTALNEVAEAAGTAESLNGFLRVACDRLRSTVDAECVAFFTVDPATRDATLVHACTRAPHGDGAHVRIPIDVLLPEGGAREHVEDVRQLDPDGPLSPALAVCAAPVATIATVPVLFRSEPVGALLVGHRAGPARGAVDLLRAVAVHFAAAIEKYRLVADLRARVEELSLLNEVGSAVASSLDVERTLSEGARALNRLVTASTCYVALLEGSELRFVASTPSTAMLLGRKLPIDGRTLVAHAVRERRTIAVDDVRTSPLVDQALAASYDGRSLLCAPLIARDQPVGAVVVAQAGVPRRFTPAEVDRITAVANHLAVAIENARLYEHLRQSYAELARTQDALVERERLAALGELAAVVAHEVRNPLGVIFNSVGALRRMVPSAEEPRMLLEIVAEEADRLNRLVGDLLDFARPSAPDLRPERLDRLVDDAVSAALVHATGGVEVRRDVAADLPPVPVDARLLRQAFVNLAANAVQAMPDGGTLTVAIHVAGIDAIVEIGDTGIGIPERARERLFEPFFTTKATGTGLGLAIVKRIVDDHGGSITVRGATPRGTVFCVRLPLSNDPAGLRDRIRSRIGGGTAR